uniref:Uncharacterized protein n=1 Tax=Oryza meridionalis TaxID=40149 RepID=A0A0E0DNM9_9ORYZ
MYQAIPPKNPKEGMYGISTAMLLSTHEKRVRRGSRCTWCRGSGLEEDCFDSVQHCTAGMKGGGACTEDGREAAPALGRKGMRCLRGSWRMRWEALAPPPVRDERRRRRATRQQGEAAREPLEKRRREAARSGGFPPVRWERGGNRRRDGCCQGAPSGEKARLRSYLYMDEITL